MSGSRLSIRRPASIGGVGLHTGVDATLTFRPAEAGQGVAFRRVDLSDALPIPALAAAVETADRRTVLGNGGVSVATVEHVLAAVAAHQIDDLWIDVDGAEPPILDGSAAPFFDLLEGAAVVSVGGEVRTFSISTALTVRSGEAEYCVTPGSNTVTVTVDWDHPCIGRMTGSFRRSPGVFAESLARARTFGFLHEVDELRSRGLIKGAHLDCAVVLSATDVVNGELRWPDEFVRHKVVDLIGDLALLGGRFDGTIEAVKPSHLGNVALVRAILDHNSTGA
jgi:UDP-3-O-acyl N-acetylglucosamine deacetylase